MDGYTLVPKPSPRDDCYLEKIASTALRSRPTLPQPMRFPSFPFSSLPSTPISLTQQSGRMIFSPLTLSLLGAFLTSSSSASALPLNGGQAQQPFLPSSSLSSSSSSSKPQVDPSSNIFLTPAILEFINSVLEQWDSPGLSVAVVRKDPEEESGWKRGREGFEKW